MKIGLTTLFICVCFLANAYAQEYHHDPEEQGKVVGTHKENPGGSRSCPVNAWIGERFVFLPKPMKGPFGPAYGHFQAGRELYTHPEYEDYVGKTMEAVRVQRLDDRWEVQFQVLGSGEMLSATTWSGGISGIAPLKDIRSARERWMGKTLWFKKRRMRSYSNGEEKDSWVQVAPGAPLRVVNVVPGSDHNTPVRFILETRGGQTGYVDLAWSRTNVYPAAWEYSEKFSSLFHTMDPSKTVGVLANGS